jgi:tetratricopeptide (TPR) repeat protein
MNQSTNSTNRAAAFLLEAAFLLAVGLVGCRSTGRTTETPENATPVRPAGIDQYVAGVRAYQSGDQEAAIANLRAATEENANLIMATSLLADLYKNSEDYEKARELYERVVKLDPYGYDGYYDLGVAQQLTRQADAAIASYQRAIALKPEHPQSNMNLGLAYLAKGDIDNAIKFITRATELDPQNPAAWAYLGLALDGKGQLPEAEKAYRTSLDLKSDQTSTLTNLGANLVRQKKTADAIAILEKATTRDPSPFAPKHYADALAMAGRFDEALTQYDLALQRNPRYLSALNEKAATLIAQYKKGLELDDTKRNAAIDTWKKSLSLNANQPRVRDALKQWEKPGM